MGVLELGDADNSKVARYRDAVRPLPSQLVQRLNLGAAAKAELAAQRNLVPPDPDIAGAKHAVNRLEKETLARLGRGMTVTRSVEVSARKSHHGLRPVPHIGIHERIAYRALTDELAAGTELHRSAEDWRKFNMGPVDYGKELTPPDEGKKKKFGRIDGILKSPIKYVIKSDVVAFYRHVNHQILADELTIRGGDPAAIAALAELLDELEAGPIGLPQLYDASDLLSEIYIEAAERDLLRRGYAVWRFNDDFRIACRSYTEVDRALEDLDASLRRIGLTLNEAKTTTPRFQSYYLEATNSEVLETGAVVTAEDVEDVVGLYTDDFTQDVEGALDALRSYLKPGGQGDSYSRIRGVGVDDLRRIRRALGGVAHAADRRALEILLPFLRFVPEVTPAAVRYILSLLGSNENAVSEVADVLDQWAQYATSDWQRLWLVYAYGETKVISADDSSSERCQRIRGWRSPAVNDVLRAYVNYVLAGVGAVNVGEVLEDLNTAPSAVHSLYAIALARLGQGVKSIWPKGTVLDALANPTA